MAWGGRKVPPAVIERSTMAGIRQLSAEEFAEFSASDRISIRRYGQLTEDLETDVTLAGATVGLVLNSDSDRVAWTISNSGTANTAALSNLQTVAVTTGIVIGPGGGAASRNAIEDGSVTGRQVFGVSTSGTTLHIVSTRAYGPVLLLPAGVLGLS